VKGKGAGFLLTEGQIHSIVHVALHLALTRPTIPSPPSAALAPTCADLPSSLRARIEAVLATSSPQRSALACPDGGSTRRTMRPQGE
jgi:hypothetical protein